MKLTAFYKRNFICLVFACLLSTGVIAQHTYVNNSKDLTSTIVELDSLFWVTYNTCNLEQMRSFFSKDLEFYHDKGGLTTSPESLIESMKKGICLNDNSRLRRELVKSSLKVYPLNNYGAILTGEHIFYIKEKGKPERPEGIAKFTHIWQHKNKEWKMTRVLSYDHQPVAANHTNPVIVLPKETLLLYEGKYEGTHSKNIVITRQNEGLYLDAGGLKAFIVPVAENKFLFKERNLEFEFVKTSNKTDKMIVRENGTIVEEAKKIQ